MWPATVKMVCTWPRNIRFDIAIVDLGLPGISGVEIIRRARKAGRKYPILILTARDGWQTKVEGLEAGADDYLVKPFHREELLARVRRAAAPLRRLGPAQAGMRTDRGRHHRQDRVS